ncbi:arrestin domain-containing protein 2-like [Sitodiplosis mosellana]|uniref:arrestin domain-containing protein 2-like n=1 Tax=Sitodiplosis mosellana TaxID=263140 RepID=UPI002443EA0D|nr:arrestin domain-containing protein 2-like [Sitodiplosis mosellana]XP_055327010.1 arrestin domain-containing protein 2-like [Sitodiplosis mosellana]
MPITCEVHFDSNPAKVVYAGQVLSGTCRLTSTEHLYVRSIFIRIQGTAHAQWREGTDENSKTFTGDEDYLNERTYFVNRSTFYAGGETRLLAGSYTYNFQCMLPPDLPSSFEGEFGYIRYCTRVVIDIPLLPDQTFEQLFTVIKAVNLNADPALRAPFIAERRKTFSPFLLCCFKSSPPMTILARIPVRGYTPGQVINLEINVKNESDQPASKFTIKLIKQVSYYVCENSTSQKHETIPILRMETRGCDIGKEEDYRVNLEVPSIPPSDFSTSNIIKVKYSISIIGSVPCFHFDPIIDLPITIGTNPIQDITPAANGDPHPDDIIIYHPTSVILPPSVSQVPDQNNQLPYSAVPSAPSAPFPFPQEEPPSYMQAMQSATIADSNNFTPKYPMYNQRTS